MSATETHVPAWTLGERLAKAREHAGISIDEMANRLGVSSRTIRNWENQAVRIARTTLMAYAAETHVPLDWIEGIDVMQTRRPNDTPDLGGSPTACNDDAAIFKFPPLAQVAA